MTPTTFPQANLTLTAPPGMPECGELPVYRGGTQLVSSWRVSWHERLSILFFGRVWLQVWGGRTQPPVAISGERTIFPEDLPPEAAEDREAAKATIEGPGGIPLSRLSRACGLPEPQRQGP